MKSIILASLILSSAGFAAIPTGNYSCSRNGSEIIKTFAISSTKAGGQELPVMTVAIKGFPSRDQSLQKSGMGQVTTYQDGHTILGFGESDIGDRYAITFNTDGTVSSMDIPCKKN